MPNERLNQKARTRAALLDAARALGEEGVAITVQAAADRAQISRATAYRYFSDPAALAAEATLHMAVKPTEELLEGEMDTRRRVHIITDYYRAFGRDHETTMRKFVARVMDAWQPGETAQRRTARRRPALELALEAERGRLSEAEFEDLVIMLTAAGSGFEQHVILTDICGLSVPESDRVARQIVDAILDRYGVA